VIYFLGAYVAGLWIGRDLDAALDRVERSVGWIAVIGGLASAALLFLFLEGIESTGPVSIRESLFYVQKLSLGLLLLLAMRAWAAKPNAWRDWTLGATAAASFGIYFLHGPLIRPVAEQVGHLIPAGKPYWALALGVAATFVGGLALSWVVILLARAVLGRRSRLVLGA
jgi:peptidoglycan/LPS O-acetylase OafA/YrhL